MQTDTKAFAEMYDFSVIRQLRKREGLTIRALSDRAGVSPAVISKLERNQTQAELETLFRLGRVLGLNATDLLSLAEHRTAHRIRATRYPSGGFEFERVQYANINCFHGHAAAGGVVSHPEIHRDCYELCWVLRGKLTLALPNERHTLNGGDALQFDAVLAHTYEALEDSEVTIVHLSKDKRF